MSTIYFDMDGVLVDFYGFLSEKLGIKADVIRTHSPDVHEVYLKFGYDYGWENLFRDASPNRLEDMKKLMKTLHDRGFVIEILTAISSDSGDRGVLQAAQTHIGKAHWLGKWYRDELKSGVISRVNVVNYGVEKSLYAITGVSNTLIDDTNRNLEEFEASGGRGILYRTWDHEACVYDIMERTLEIP